MNTCSQQTASQSSYFTRMHALAFLWGMQASHYAMVTRSAGLICQSGSAIRYVRQVMHPRLVRQLECRLAVLVLPRSLCDQQAGHHAKPSVLLLIHAGWHPGFKLHVRQRRPI